MLGFSLPLRCPAPPLASLAIGMALLESAPSVLQDRVREGSYDEKAVDKESLTSRSSSEPVAVWDDVTESREKVIGSRRPVKLQEIFQMIYFLYFHRDRH